MAPLSFREIYPTITAFLKNQIRKLSNLNRFQTKSKGHNGFNRTDTPSKRTFEKERNIKEISYVRICKNTFPG